MVISLEERRYFSDKYEDFCCLLLYFQEDTYSDHPDDLRVIKEFVLIPTFDGKYLQSVIDQGKEILDLEEFPSEWIGETRGGIFFNEIDTKDWIQWILSTLETEAKKVGKL